MCFKMIYEVSFLGDTSNVVGEFVIEGREYWELELDGSINLGSTSETATPTHNQVDSIPFVGEKT